LGNNQSKYHRRQANQAKRHTIIILSRKNEQSLHPGRNRSTNRKTAKKPHYRISRNSANTTTIFTSANTNSANKQYYRIRQKLESLLYASHKLGQEILPLRISMPTTINDNYQEKKGNSASKSEERITRNMKRKLEKSSYFIKRKQTKTLTFHQHDILTRNFESLKTSHTKTELKKNIINTSQINTDTHCSDSKSCLIRGKLAVYESQLRLQLVNLTVQATNRGEHSVLLFPVLQENVVTPQIHHISLQMLDAGLEIRLLMLKPHPLKQRFLVLLQVLTAPKPPVKNY
jgi:hypothetical protein